MYIHAHLPACLHVRLSCAHTHTQTYIIALCVTQLINFWFHFTKLITAIDSSFMTKVFKVPAIKRSLLAPLDVSSKVVVQRGKFRVAGTCSIYFSTCCAALRWHQYVIVLAMLSRCHRAGHALVMSSWWPFIYMFSGPGGGFKATRSVWCRGQTRDRWVPRRYRHPLQHRTKRTRRSAHTTLSYFIASPGNGMPAWQATTAKYLPFVLQYLFDSIDTQTGSAADGSQKRYSCHCTCLGQCRSFVSVVLVSQRSVFILFFCTFENTASMRVALWVFWFIQQCLHSHQSCP